MIKLKHKNYVVSLIKYTHTNHVNMKKIRLLFISILIFQSVFVSSQVPDIQVYEAEVGINGGGSFYLGEANNILFNNIQPEFGGFFRYLLNSRIAFKAELTSTSVSGNGFNQNSIYIGDLLGEFNFFDLEQNPYKQFSKIYSPYIFTGISLFTDVCYDQQFPEFGIPFGVGLKVKLGNRWNLNAQWTSRLLFADNIEGTTSTGDHDSFNNPNNLNGSNTFNNDLISTFSIGISYNILKKQCDCLNQNSKRKR